MFSTDTCIQRYLSKMNKTREELDIDEQIILAGVVRDNTLGRYSKFLMWSEEQRESFFAELKENNVVYTELSDPERWACEDAFEMTDV